MSFASLAKTVKISSQRKSTHYLSTFLVKIPDFEILGYFVKNDDFDRFQVIFWPFWPFWPILAKTTYCLAWQVFQISGFWPFWPILGDFRGCHQNHLFFRGFFVIQKHGSKTQKWQKRPTIQPRYFICTRKLNNAPKNDPMLPGLFLAKMVAQKSLILKIGPFGGIGQMVKMTILADFGQKGTNKPRVVFAKIRGPRSPKIVKIMKKLIFVILSSPTFPYENKQFFNF